MLGLGSNVRVAPTEKVETQVAKTMPRFQEINILGNPFCLRIVLPIVCKSKGVVWQVFPANPKTLKRTISQHKQPETQGQSG